MLTFGLYTQVSDSGSHGPLVNIFFLVLIFFYLLACLDEVQEEILHYPRRWRWRWRWRRRRRFYVKVFYVMGKALSGELSCPCDRSCFFLFFYFDVFFYFIFIIFFIFFLFFIWGVGEGVVLLKPKQYARLSNEAKYKKSNHQYNVEHVVQSTFQTMLITF